MTEDQLHVAKQVEGLRLMAKAECDEATRRRIRDLLNEVVAEFSTFYERVDGNFDPILFQARCWRDSPASEMLD